jgi:arginine N-succinyltransferase
MHYEGYVDIFDAGPVLQGRVAELRAVRDSVLTTVDEGVPEGECEATLVSNTKLDDFRMVLAQACNGGTNRPCRRANCAAALPAGDEVRTLTLNVRKNTHG